MGRWQGSSGDPSAVLHKLEHAQLLRSKPAMQSGRAASIKLQVLHQQQQQGGGQQATSMGIPASPSMAERSYVKESAATTGSSMGSCVMEHSSSSARSGSQAAAVGQQQAPPALLLLPQLLLLQRRRMRSPSLPVRSVLLAPPPLLQLLPARLPPCQAGRWNQLWAHCCCCPRPAAQAEAPAQRQHPVRPAVLGLLRCLLCLLCVLCLWSLPGLVHQPWPLRSPHLLPSPCLQPSDARGACLAASCRCCCRRRCRQLWHCSGCCCQA